jgi:hypothetical protein
VRSLLWPFRSVENAGFELRPAVPLRRAENLSNY